MNIDVGYFVTKFDMFLLVFVRMTALFVISPIFGRQNLPTPFKVGFSLFLSIILLNTLGVANVNYYDNIFYYTLLVGKEFLIGIILGYISYLIFSAIYLAGQIIDTQMGFGIVSVLDPISNIQIPISANFYYLITTLFFLILDGHHMLIRALFKSFEVIPIGTMQLNPLMIEHFTNLMTTTFIIGIKVAAPVVMAILVTDIVLGILSKSMPQMNIFMVGMPLKIVIGLLIVVLTIPAFTNIAQNLGDIIVEAQGVFLQDMAPKPVSVTPVPSSTTGH